MQWARRKNPVWRQFAHTGFTPMTSNARVRHQPAIGSLARDVTGAPVKVWPVVPVMSTVM